MYKTVGLVFMIGSITLSLLSYLLIDAGGSFIIYYGILALGLFAFVKGILDMRAAEAELQQAQEATTSIP